MNRLKHDLKEVSNSLLVMKNIISGEINEVEKMKPILVDELKRLISILDHTSNASE